MKNNDIRILELAGVLTASVHDLSPEHAYKVSKLKIAIKNAMKNINEQEKDLLTEAGIDSEKDIDKTTGIIQPKTKDGKLEQEKLDKFEMLKKAQMEDDTPINVKKIPYQEWLKLYNENKNKEVSRNINGKVYTKGIDIFGTIEVEEILAGVLFDYPVDEEEDAPKEKNTKAAE